MYRIWIAVLLFACNGTTNQERKTDSVIVVEKKPLIPVYRDEVNSKPVKQFSKVLVGHGLQGTFSVRLFETKKTFHYLMKIRYAEFEATDTLKLPNFGMEPKPEIQQGDGLYSCIIGFYDEQNSFRKYKQISVKNDRVSVKTLNHYAVATYRDEM